MTQPENAAKGRPYHLTKVDMACRVHRSTLIRWDRKGWVLEVCIPWIGTQPLTGCSLVGESFNLDSCQSNICHCCVSACRMTLVSSQHCFLIGADMLLAALFVCVITPVEYRLISHMCFIEFKTFLCISRLPAALLVFAWPDTKYRAAALDLSTYDVKIARRGKPAHNRANTREGLSVSW